MNTIDTDTLVQRNEERYLATALGDEIIMMDTNSGDYIGINSLGAEIWNLIIQPITVNNLIQQLLQLYKVPADVCHIETIAFLNKLNKQGLLICVN